MASLLNNSDSIRRDMDSMMYHMGSLISLKQSVVDSVSTYVEQNRCWEHVGEENLPCHQVPGHAGSWKRVPL